MKLAVTWVVFVSWAGVASRVTAQPAPEAAAGEVSRDGIMRRVEQAGRTKPDWWDATPMQHPASLDLSWPKPTGRWNAERNPSQYLVSVVSRRPDLFRSAAKMCQQVVAARDTTTYGRRAATDWLARVYARFLADYARGAYWYLRLRESHNGLAGASSEGESPARSRREPVRG